MGGHVRRWAAVMVALILVKPVTVIVLGLAATLESTGEHGPVITGIGVTALSLMAAIYIIAKLPGLGDTIRAGRIVARTTGAAVGTVAGAASASADVMRGIQTHSSRTVPPQKGNTARNSGGKPGSYWRARRSQQSTAKEIRSRLRKVTVIGFIV